MAQLLTSVLLSQQQQNIQIANLNFASVFPQFTNLRGIIQGTSSYAAYDDTLCLQLNGDTNANYSWQQLKGSGSTATISSMNSALNAVIGRLPAALASGEYSGFADVLIPNYLNTTFFPIFTSKWGECWGNGANMMAVGQNSGVYIGGTVQLNQLTFLLQNGMFGVGTLLQLWGE